MMFEFVFKYERPRYYINSLRNVKSEIQEFFRYSHKPTILILQSSETTIIQ